MVKLLLAVLLSLSVLCGTASAQTAAPVCWDDGPRPLRAGTSVSGYLTMQCSGAMSFEVLGTPQHVEVAIFATYYTVTAEAGYTGAGSFTFRATGPGGSTEHTLEYAIAPDANHAPECHADPRRTRLGASRPQVVECYDADGDPVSATVAAGPRLGRVTAVDGEQRRFRLAYTAPEAAPLPAEDTLTLRVDDAHGGVTDVEVAIPLVAADANAAPTCWAPATRTLLPQEDAGWYSDCEDPDGDAYRLELVDGPELGTAEIRDGTQLWYSASRGRTGSDAVTVRPVDDRGLAGAGVVLRYEIQAPPAPTCRPTTPVTVRPAQMALITFDCAPGFGGGGYEYAVEDAPDHGTLRHADPRSPSFTYVAGDAAAEDAFTVRVTAGGVSSTTVRQEVEVTQAANVPPTCAVVGRMLFPTALPLHVREGGRRTFAVACSDTDRDPLEVAVDTPGHGTVAHDLTADSPGFIRYDAAYVAGTGSAGDDQVRVRVRDAHGAETTTSVPVTVNPAGHNQAPGCMTPAPGSGPRAGGTYTFRLWCGDADGDANTLAISDLTGGSLLDVRSEPGTSMGGVDGTDYAVRVRAGATPGTFGFTATPSDAGGAGTPAHVGYQVRSPEGNNPPMCMGAPERAVVRDHPTDLGSLALFCVDFDEDPLTATITTPPTQGRLELQPDGGYDYVPAPSAAGTDAFTVTVSDGQATTTRTETLILRPSPETVLEAAPPEHTPDRTATFRFSVAGDPEAGFTCRLDGREADICRSPYRTRPLRDGEHVLEVTGRSDNLGDPTPVVHRWTVGPAPPETTITAGPAGRSFLRTAVFRFAAGDRAECRLDDAAWAPCTSPLTLTDLAPGERTLRVRSLDSAGNPDPTPATRTWTVAAPPEGAAVAQTTVDAGGGTATAGGTTVAVPAGTDGGAVSIVSVPAPAGAPPSGYALIGREVHVEAPEATAAAPLRLTFDVDRATLDAAGLTAATVAIVRDGVVVGACTGPAGRAAPDPCIAERTATGTGARLVVLSSHASRWNVARALPPAPATTGSPAPTPTPTPTPTRTPVAARTPPPAAVPDRTPPRLTLTAGRQRARPVARRGLALAIGCDESCAASVVLKLRGRRIGAGTFAAGAVRVRLTRAGRRRLARAAPATVTATVVAVDAAGNVATRRVRVRVRRSRP